MADIERFDLDAVTFFRNDFVSRNIKYLKQRNILDA